MLLDLKEDTLRSTNNTFRFHKWWPECSFILLEDARTLTENCSFYASLYTSCKSIPFNLRCMSMGITLPPCTADKTGVKLFSRAGWMPPRDRYIILLILRLLHHNKQTDNNLKPYLNEMQHIETLTVQVITHTWKTKTFVFPVKLDQRHMCIHFRSGLSGWEQQESWQA